MIPYQSTEQDTRRARILGTAYVILSVLLAYMLFVVWPPVPWPTPERLKDDPEAVGQLGDEARKCGCEPTPSPTPSPSPSPTPTVPQSPTPTPSQAPSARPTEEAKPASTAKPQGDSEQPKKEIGATRKTDQGNTGEANGNSVRRLPRRLPLKIFGWPLCTTYDERLILLVIIAGMLGAFVHGATSLADFTGNYNFKKTWTLFYVLRPVIGMSLALVFYFMIRGGFLTTNAGAQDINPYGIAALAGMVGMFSKQATDKLSEVFSTLFKSTEGGDKKRKDPLGTKAMVISKVDPPQLTVGSQNRTIQLSGSNFVSGATVMVNDDPQTTTFTSASQLSAELKPGLVAQPGILKVKVVNPNQVESEATDLPVV